MHAVCILICSVPIVEGILMTTLPTVLCRYLIKLFGISNKAPSPEPIGVQIQNNNRKRKFISLWEKRWNKIPKLQNNVLNLIESLGWSHGALHMKGPNILPMFLQERNQKVDCQMNVLGEFLRAHTNVSNSDTETEYLFRMKVQYILVIVTLFRNMPW